MCNWKWALVLVCVVASLVRGEDPPMPTPDPLASGPIKVGITVSNLTAITKSPSGKPWGFDVQTRIVAELNSPDMEFIPVIESGTEKEDAQVAQLTKVFPNKTPIDGSDPAALKKLDVLVAHEDWMVPHEMLMGVHQAAKDGLPLLNIGGLGWASPGLATEGSPAGELTGFKEVQGGYTSNPVLCKIVKTHPLLGDWNKQQTISLRLLGAYGELPPDATPLVQIADPATMKVRGPKRDNPNMICYPMYISHLGNGPIVGIDFALFAYNKPDRGKLLQRCVKFLAGRAVE